MRINPRVIIMREAITKIVPMLSRMQVVVTMRGMKAFVDFHPTTFAPIRVNLPYLPDDCSDELIEAIQGFLDHEVAHILFTDPQEILRAVKTGKAVAFLHNALEDPMVEGMMRDRFTGSAYNLSLLLNFFVDKMLKKNLAEAIMSGDTNKITSALVVPAIRAWAGQQECIDFMEDKWPLIDDWVRSVGTDLIDAVPRCKNSRETCDLALEIFKRIGEVAPPPPPPEEKPEDAEKGKSEGPQEDGSGEGDPEEGDPTKTKSGKGEPELADKGGSEPGADESSKDEPGQHGNERPKMNSDLRDKMLAAINNQKDFDASVAEALSERVQQDARNSEYLIFTRDDDKIEPMETTSEAVAGIPSMQGEVDEMLGPLVNEIERMIKARSAATWTGGHRRGRLHGSALTRVMFGRDDVFRRKQENHTKDVAVSLVPDCSGSMTNNGKLKTAMYTAYAIASILDRLGISNEVVGFSTRGHSAQVLNDLSKDPKRHEYSRCEAIYMPIFKGFGERMGADVRARFVQATIARNLCRSNVDGESILLAHGRLVARRETRKIMIVLSDGQPAVSGGGDLDGHLKAVVKQIEASGTDIVGIGIMDQSVKKFYKKFIIMKSVKDLPAVVTGELKDLLTK